MRTLLVNYEVLQPFLTKMLKEFPCYAQFLLRSIMLKIMIASSAGPYPVLLNPPV